MGKSITPNQIKENNRNLIYQYIYQNRKVSQQDISFDLHLSRPTITTNLTNLEADGLIQKNGLIDSEYVGRKAAAYSIVSDYRIGIGVEILKKEIKMVAVDLYGEMKSRFVFAINYENSEIYYKSVCDKILAFKNSMYLSDAQILGVGFAMQALISPDKSSVIYGKILSCTGLSIRSFSKYLPFPCSFIHDAESAAVSELWVSPELEDAFYLSISKHLGAAMISKGMILTGKHGHSATIEHIEMQPGGALCYCGKYGCMETLCSINALLKESESLDDFFKYLRMEDSSHIARWNHFLTNLAKAINSLHLVYDTDFILGGYLAPYLCENDLLFLHDKIHQMTPFEEPADFIHISKMPENNIAIGAALQYILDFLEK